MHEFLLWMEVFGGILTLIGGVVTFLVWIKKIVEGQKCQLRAHMLQSYYRHVEEKTIRQYELENFMLMYKAYKSLKGNSFVDKIYSEVIKWKVIT